MTALRSSVRKFKPLSERQQEFDALCAWIDANLHESIGWQELMVQSGLDHQTINALFYRFQSTTPMTWIRKRRELALASAPVRRRVHRVSA
ncbi:MAG: hypothetical protein OEV31_05020 [Gammaproteobacteria bacterium]|nr:hypothetical protein [Gammaproteobacteria bacterium]